MNIGIIAKEGMGMIRKIQKEVVKEIENIKELRKKLENQSEEVEQIKEVLIKVGESFSKVVGVVESAQKELQLHKRAITEIFDIINKDDEKEEDVMYK